MTLFSYVHLTDFHFCQEPLRKNAPFLIRRPWNEIIDTVRDQGKELGFSSLFLPASFDPEIAKGVAQFCDDWSDSIDGIIVTGDLATTGMANDVGVAEKFIKEPAITGYLSYDRFPTIASLDLPIHLFAGNHDRYLNNRGRPFSNYFDIAFETFMDKKGDFVGSWISEKEDKQLAFVHADFTLRNKMGATFPRQKNVFGQGRIYDDVLTDLKEETFAIRREFNGAPIIWLIHFAPYECGSTLKLVDHQKLLDAGKALGVAAILCGHTHEAMVKSSVSQMIYCGGSSCCVDNVGGCMIHIMNFDVGEKFEISRVTFVWSEDEGEFIHLKDD